MSRILILCPYPTGLAAGQRLKYEQYVEDWRQAGYDVTISPFMDVDLWTIAYVPGNLVRKLKGVAAGYLRRWRDVLRIGRYDAVYVFMWVTPFGSTWMERLVSRGAKRLIYDIEDNLLASQPGVGRFRQWLKGRGKTQFLLERADHVLTASPFMVERYREINRAGAVTLIYPSVDTDAFRPRDGASRETKPVIGWTGTFSSRPYLDLLVPVLRELARRVDYKLIVIGNFDYALPGVDLKVLTWSREEEVAQMQRLDIGVYPLPDDDWTLGKAGLKVIQYMAFGLPSVSSAVGTATVQVTDGVDGFLVRSEAEWLDVLERLCRDPGLRARIGAAGRVKAVARYSRAATSGQYLAVLQSVIGRPDAARTGDDATIRMT